MKRSLELLSPEEKQAVSEGLSILSRALEKAKKNKSVSLSSANCGSRLFYLTFSSFKMNNILLVNKKGVDEYA